MRHRGLGRAVGGVAATGDAPHHRGDIDDGTAAALEHDRHRRQVQGVRRRDVEVEGLFHVLRRRHQERQRDRAAHVVDDDVDTTELPASARGELGDRAEVTEVTGHADRAPTERFHLPRDRLAGLELPARDDNIGAGLRKRQHPRNPRIHPFKAHHFRLQMPDSRIRNPVNPRRPALRRSSQLRLHPPLTQHPLQRRVKRTLFHLEQIVRDLLNVLDQRIPMHRPQQQRLQNHDLQRPGK